MLNKLIPTALGCAVLAASTASAERVVFDNRDGVLEWEPFIFNVEKPGVWLDITKSPEDNPAGYYTGSGDTTTPAHALIQYLSPQGPSSSSYTTWSVGGKFHLPAAQDRARVATQPDPMSLPVNDLGPPPDIYQYSDFFFVETLAPGSTVDPGADYTNNSNTSFLGSDGSPVIVAWPDLFVGVRFPFEGQTHYGWVQLKLRMWNGFPQGYNPVAWGYETTPNTPVEIIDVRDLTCPGDLDGDGVANAADLAILLGSWGDTGTTIDVDGSNFVDAADLAQLLGSWGPCL